MRLPGYVIVWFVLDLWVRSDEAKCETTVKEVIANAGIGKENEKQNGVAENHKIERVGKK